MKVWFHFLTCKLFMVHHVVCYFMVAVISLICTPILDKRLVMVLLHLCIILCSSSNPPFFEKEIIKNNSVLLHNSHKLDGELHSVIHIKNWYIESIVLTALLCFYLLKLRSTSLYNLFNKIATYVVISFTRLFIEQRNYTNSGTTLLNFFPKKL